MKKPKSYKAAWEELQDIQNSLESEDIDVDNLAELVKRASYLVKFCQEKIRSVESELSSQLEDE